MTTFTDALVYFQFSSGELGFKLDSIVNIQVIQAILIKND